VKLYYINTDGLGVHVRNVKADVKTTESRRGEGEAILVKLAGMDPVGDGEIAMSEAEARDLRDGLNKIIPSLSSVTGGKK